MFIFSGNWMKNRILGKSFFSGKIYPAQLAELSSICSDVNFGETNFFDDSQSFWKFSNVHEQKAVGL